ncbi:DDE Tnp 1 7 domain containing protein [Asbolus verrucosus]|uniref:DDE Tnp 1 7 domain containing protein n=1 Tax=Asbolus verrucosus TaxID=1661398 RepID=A0A482VLB8_ASBVE|nr:DDE Tnp 1 7 domain containing protein [Asbolus verrucosus]
MGCVDRADVLKSYYAIDRKSKKWWHRLFFHFLDTALANPFILFRKRTKSTLKLKDFRLEIVCELVGANCVKEAPGRKSDSISKFKVLVSKNVRTDQSKHMPIHNTSRRCALCSTSKEPHKTRWYCTVCKVGLCMTTNKNCFAEYHKT